MSIRVLGLGDDVVRLFDADREPEVAIGHTSLELLLGAELRASGGSRVDSKRARITYVGNLVEHLQRIDEPAPGVQASLELEAEQATVSAFQVGLDSAPLSLAVFFVVVC